VLVNRQSTPWIVVSLILFVIATIIYIPYAHSQPNGASGGSWEGITYGIVGTALMAFAMLLALKKALRTNRALGPARPWMQGHVWLSLLSYPLILYHAGLHWGQPWHLTWAMMWVFTIVVVSGIYGVIIQNVLPRRMMNEVQLETIYDEIDHVIKQLAGEAETIATNASAIEEEEDLGEPASAGGGTATALAPAALLTTSKRRLAEFYESQVKPYLSSARGKGLALSNPSQSSAAFDDLRRALPPSMRPQLDDIQEIVNERRQLERQRSLHHWLHGWLLVHVPLSYALTVLAIVHIVVALRYR
jgi:hypothetical protein